MSSTLKNEDSITSNVSLAMPAPSQYRPAQRALTPPEDTPGPVTIPPGSPARSLGSNSSAKHHTKTHLVFQVSLRIIHKIELDMRPDWEYWHGFAGRIPDDAVREIFEDVEISRLCDRAAR